MSLSMEKRMEIATQASADRAIARLREADSKLDDGISWVLCSCPNCAHQRSWMRMQVARRVRRKRMRNVGVLLVAASVLALFLLLKGLPILRALNY